MFDEQPIGALLALSWAHSREDPASVKLFALQSEIQLPFRISLLGGLAIPKAAIPDHDRSATVLAFRDRAFEVAVIQGMVLDLDRQSFVMGIQRWTLGDGPGFEDAVQFEP
jgi:hypothetical protein